jgi:hypothetical protein
MPHSTPQTVNLTIIVEPGGSQEVNGYLEVWDRMALSWQTDGADLAYRYHVESGHETPSILAIGLSSDGEQQSKAAHGGFYGIGLRNFTGRRVTDPKGHGHLRIFQGDVRPAQAGVRQVTRLPHIHSQLAATASGGRPS